MYYHEVYCFTVDATGLYDFNQSNDIGGTFICLLQGYDEDIDFYLAPNLVGVNQVQANGSFQTNLNAGTIYYLLLKDGSGTGSGTAVVSGPGNIDFAIAPPSVPTLGQWGIMTLGLIVLIFGVVSIRQRQVQLGKRSF